jgi:hypothetical protein
MKFGKESWLVLFREYIIPKLFAVWAMAEGEDLVVGDGWGFVVGLDGSWG